MPSASAGQYNEDTTQVALHTQFGITDAPILAHASGGVLNGVVSLGDMHIFLFFHFPRTMVEVVFPKEKVGMPRSMAHNQAGTMAGTIRPLS